MSSPTPFEDFLASDEAVEKIRPGARCSICPIENVETLNDAIRTYVDRRDRPVGDPERTAMTTMEFIRLYVQKQFPELAQKDPRSIRRHAQKCLEAEL